MPYSCLNLDVLYFMIFGKTNLNVHAYKNQSSSDPISANHKEGIFSAIIIRHFINLV